MSSVPYRIIFVPGIRPKPEPDQHQAQIRRCAYHGVLSAGGAPEEARAVSDALDLVGWSYSFYEEHGEIDPDMPGIERLLAGTDDEASVLRKARSPALRVNSFLYSLADRFPVLGSHFSTSRMQSRISEIRRYFANRDGRSEAIRQMVTERLLESWNRGESIVLAGHSFGAIIAYDTLWELSQKQCQDRVALFLSLGSPLTMRFIRRRLLGASRRGKERYPSLINEWVNYSAVGEVASSRQKLARLFAPMVVSGQVQHIHDDLELINTFHGPDGLNVHKCYGYFASRLVGALLLDWHRRL